MQRKEKFLTLDDAKAAVIGGAVLGGGGGGAMENGFAMAELAVNTGKIRLASLDELKESDILLTVSVVGAPAAKNRHIVPNNYIRTVEYFAQCFNCRPAGLITNECGGNATVNGWLQAAQLGLPLIDAPCNGRAHPTGVMGSIGLHKIPDFVSKQTAAGGNPDLGLYLEIAVSGSLDNSASLIRTASINAGGVVAVARNPVTVKYARANTAAGAIKQSIELGKVMVSEQEKGKHKNVASAIADFLEGEIIITGTVKDLVLETKGGFDVGTVVITNGKKEITTTFWNEYMTIEDNNKRLGTFPDLISTIDTKTGLNVTTAEIRKNQEISLLYVPKEKLFLGSGMHDPALFEVAEKAVNRKIIKYVF